jgi:DNA polymerase III subunit delta
MKNYGKEPDYLRLKREIQAGMRRPVYIFTGSEDFLMEEAVFQVRLAMGIQAGSTDVSRVDGMTVSLDQVLNMVETVSLFGESRFLVVKEAPYFEKGAGEKASLERLMAYRNKKDELSCLVICAPNFARTTKEARELSADGSVYLFEPLKSGLLAIWLRERIAATGIKASKPVLDLFVERVGRDLRRLAGELDKMATYLGDNKEMDENSVMQAASRSFQGDIFALMDAVVHGRASKALYLLKDLLASGEPPLRVLAMLVRQFRLLGQARHLLQNGSGVGELPDRLGIKPYAAEILASQARLTDEERLYRAVELLLQADLDIKRGKIDQVLALETLVVALGEKSA